MPRFTSDVELGIKYRDPQTGIEGTATSVHFYQYACERVTLEVMTNDGELNEYTFDAPRLEPQAGGRRLRTERTGGPGNGARQPSSRAALPGRGA